jgi:glycosyltransferase involved in cell wall biosynthesis
MSGYAVSAKRYIVGLTNLGLPLTWTPMVAGARWGLRFEPFTGRTTGDKELDPFCNREIDYDTVIIHLPPEFFPLWVRHEPNKRIIGYTVWETDRLPRPWPVLLNSVDRIMVPCEFNKKVFEACGVRKPVHVVPHIFGDEGPSSRTLPWAIEPDEYVFYTIETWSPRKAVRNTIRCYLDTFSARDRTVLLVKTSRDPYTESYLKKFGIVIWTAGMVRRLFGISSFRSLRPDAPNFLKTATEGSAGSAKILLTTEELSDQDILAFHRRGDCYVSLCRSEGWGLAPFTAAGFGKPVIITGFGGQLDYLPRDSAFLVDFDLVPARDDYNREHFTPDQRWAEPKMTSASALMRHVYENQEAAKSKGGLLRDYVLGRFREEAVMTTMMNVIA